MKERQRGKAAKGEGRRCRNMMGFGENALKNRDIEMRGTRVFHLSRLFREAGDKLKLICGRGRIAHFLTDQFTPMPPERVIINSGFLIGFGDDTQSGEKRSSLLWIFCKKVTVGQKKEKKI